MGFFPASYFPAAFFPPAYFPGTGIPSVPVNPPVVDVAETHFALAGVPEPAETAFVAANP